MQELSKLLSEQEQAELLGEHWQEEEPSSNTWPEPEPIKTTLLPVENLPLEIIPGPFREWLVDISYRMQCPVDFVVVGAVVAIGSVIGAGCGIRPKQKDNWTVIPNLWGGPIARPAMLKTPALAEAMKPLKRLEAEAREKYEDMLLLGEAEYEIFKAQKEALKKKMLSSAKGVKGATQTLDSLKEEYASLEAPEIPTRRRYLTNDATIEKIAELLNENPRGILHFRDELTGLLVSWEREDRQSDRAFYLEAWNGYGSYTTDRIGRGTIDTNNLCISILGGIQPSRLTGYLLQAKDSLQNDGMIQRFQLLVYPDEPKNWQLVDEYPKTEAKEKAYRIFKALSEMNFTEYGAEQIEGEKRPYFHFSKEAQEVFNEWLSDLQARLQTEEDLLMVEHLSKYRSLMPSIALIDHLINVADGTASGPVSLRSAKKAAAWCEYLESHARRIYGLVGNVGQRAAAELAKKLKAKKLQEGFTVRDVYRNQWHLLTSKEAVKAACDELAEAGWLQEIVPKDSKKRIAYLVNPKIFS